MMVECYGVNDCVMTGSVEMTVVRLPWLLML